MALMTWNEVMRRCFPADGGAPDQSDPRTLEALGFYGAAVVRSRERQPEMGEPVLPLGVDYRRAR